jgi:putative endonuclease
MAGFVPAIHGELGKKGIQGARRMGIHHDEPVNRHTVRWRNRRPRAGAWEHRAGLVDGFTKQYGLKRLVLVERYDDMRLARQRERNMKHWRRSWKIRLILSQNPNWDDLYDRLS